jgi:tartrate dehydrogenase/decarboxylase/D-malate dehydrogenase
LREIQEEYPDVESHRQHVDLAALHFIRRPQQFDVVVASNLLGEILTDLGGAIVGAWFGT